MQARPGRRADEARGGGCRRGQPHKSVYVINPIKSYNLCRVGLFSFQFDFR